MSTEGKVRSSAFRDALQVTPRRIAAFDDAELNECMRELLYAEASRCGADPSEIRVNTELKAGDDGADGWSPKPATRSAWLGGVETCWQFKAGSAGEPALLKGKVVKRKGVTTKQEGEVTKRLPRQTLLEGGRFVVVASGSTSGLKGEKERLSALREEAEAMGLPTQRIEVFGSERLANWCNQHPAIAAKWAGREGGELWRLADWLQSHEHARPWQETPAIAQKIADLRRELDFAQGAVWHLHIQGPPGVGKTRLALELCRGAEWRSAVVYVRQAADLRLAELIDGATAAATVDEGVRLLVVVDEAQDPRQLRHLREAIGRAQGRVRLLTIGHGTPPNPKDIPLYRVGPLERETMESVVRGRYPLMATEHVDFVVDFADGYVRLAHLAADAVADNPATSIRGLLDLEHVRGFFDSMLGPRESRRCLYVVAVLTSVGWTEEGQAEGRAIARHLGLDWNEVLVQVESFHDRLKIVPRAGRLRHISPAPLGNYLAAEAWGIYADLLMTLPGVLPTQEAQDAYYERLRSIASSHRVRRFAREGLSTFVGLDNFLTVQDVRRWSALSAADPELAARQLCAALSAAPLEARERVVWQSRREMVKVLVRLAWRRKAFRSAVFSLALLAEVEIERGENDATVEFARKFQLRLGGTEVPYDERLYVLDELLSFNRPAFTRLVVLALARSAIVEWRVGVEPASDEPPAPEWGPVTTQGVVDCLKLAIGRLTVMAESGQEELRDELTKAALALSRWLQLEATRSSIALYFESVRSAYPAMREPLRRAIEKVIRHGRARRTPLPERALAELEAIHRNFEDPSLPARLRQFVGRDSPPGETPATLLDLASELLEDNAALAEVWPWLTSGEAAGAERLGEALAELDTAGILGSTLPVLEARGSDLRLLCAYVNKRCEHLGVSWVDAWLEAQVFRDPDDVHLLFEILGHCSATERMLSRAASVLREGRVSSRLVSQLGRNPRLGGGPAGPQAELLRALIESGHQATAIALLDRCWKLRPDETEPWKGIALKLVTSAGLIRGTVLESFHWKQVADRLVEGHARSIAAAIFRAQADVSSGIWFEAHSDAGATLYRCAAADPAGVWSEFAPYLLKPEAVAPFRLGLPRWLLERLPIDSIKAWTLEDPEARAVLIAQVVSKSLESADDDDESREQGCHQPVSTLSRSLSSDHTVASWLLSEFADDEKVAKQFWESCVSGTWEGAWSTHLLSRAVELEGVATRTSLPRLRRWAEKSAESLRQMAERLQQREAEEVVRGR